MSRNLNSYYYSFEHTGNDTIDAILEAVAQAGRMYHNTDGWNNQMAPGHLSPIEAIQNAANLAAERKNVCDMASGTHVIPHKQCLLR